MTHPHDSTRPTTRPIAGELAVVWQMVWDRLERSVNQPDDPWREGVFATSRVPGGDPFGLRTVILRRVERDAAALTIHTDARSPKIAQIEADPAVEWLGCDRRERLQIRLAGRATIHRADAVAEALWNESSPLSLRGYLGGHPPGTPVESDTPDPNLPAWVLERGDRLTREEVQPGRAHFAAVRIVVYAVEMLQLDRAGHRRARFDRVPNDPRTLWTGGWIMP